MPAIFVKIFAVLKPFLIDWALSLIVHAAQKIKNWWTTRQENKKAKKDLADSQRRESNAKSKEDQENAHKDVIDKSNG